LLVFKKQEYLPIVIRGCLNDDQPYKWWERFMSACEIVNVKKALPPPPASQNSAYLCASILSYPDQYSALLPPHPNIDDRAVERASLSDVDIGAMKEAYNVLTTATSSILEVLRSNDEARKLYYMRAVAYRMLIMEGPDHHGLDKIKGLV
jgi:hypothetical protein